MDKDYKIHRSAYIPKTLLGEVEEITDTDKKLSVNKAINEGLRLWLKQIKKGGK